MSRTVAQHNVLPSLKDIVVFYIKSRLLILRRTLKELFKGPKKHSSSTDATGNLMAHSSTPLWTNTVKEEEILTVGKVENLRRALVHINGIRVSANQEFSFWKQIGRPVKRRGFVEGREIREGCIIPTIGGGLCQLSNALYDAALKSGIEITERHAHTAVIKGSLAEKDRDATVFWNYVDLRFKPSHDLYINAIMTENELIIEFYGTPDSNTVKNESRIADALGNCLSCGMTSCAKHVESPPEVQTKRAWLLDEVWPEHKKFMQSNKREGDTFHLPLDSARWKKPAYNWDSPTEISFYSTRVAIKRGLAVRKLKGGMLQDTLMHYDRRLAKSMAKQLTAEHMELFVSQNLLPHLWELGALWGRKVNVLMTRLPMYALQGELDKAHAAHPSSSTLNDFRANDNLVRNEQLALDLACSVVSPHQVIQKLYAHKIVNLEWDVPRKERSEKKKDLIIFGSTPLARKGVLEFFEALKGYNYNVAAPGNTAESPIIRGRIQKLPSDWRERTICVIIPAYVENRPRIALDALAHGIPVYVSEQCGLNGLGNRIEINPKAIREAIEEAVVNA